MKTSSYGKRVTTPFSTLQGLRAVLGNSAGHSGQGPPLPGSSTRATGNGTRSGPGPPAPRSHSIPGPRHCCSLPYPPLAPAALWGAFEENPVWAEPPSCEPVLESCTLGAGRV